MDYITSKATVFEHYDALFICAPIVIILLVIVLWQKQVNKVKIMDKFPGPKKNLLFGNSLQFQRDPSDFRDQVLGWSKDYMDKGAFCMWLTPFHPFLYMYKPEYAEILLNNSRQISKSYEYTFVHPWLGTGK
ncbi:hypothetical protein QZH41_014279 [Actinostola sp. cb2023]|nr:hypothetical protein QZH41_014279 [Actinostola sp. cb2023]